MKRFYFSTQTGNVIHDDLALDDAAAIIRELRERGYYYCYSLWV